MPNRKPPQSGHLRGQLITHYLTASLAERFSWKPPHVELPEVLHKVKSIRIDVFCPEGEWQLQGHRDLEMSAFKLLRGLPNSPKGRTITPEVITTLGMKLLQKPTTTAVAVEARYDGGILNTHYPLNTDEPITYTAVFAKKSSLGVRRNETEAPGLRDFLSLMASPDPYRRVVTCSPEVLKAMAEGRFMELS